MKRALFTILLFASLSAYSQITVNILTPPSGMVDKQQLWNMVIANGGQYSTSVSIHLTFTEAVSGQPVMEATTNFITVPPGSKQFSADGFSPISYTVLSSAYKIDAAPTGLLPIGTFNVCYNFIEVKSPNPILQECMIMNIPPLSPPMLALPEDGAEINIRRPLFVWLPPTPTDFFSALQYDFRLVELYPNQSAADAIQQNVPVLFQHAVLTNNLQYPSGVNELDTTKRYAWQITANNNLNEIGKSEVWTFGFPGPDSSGTITVSDTMYIKLEKQSEGNGVFFNKLRINYYNETSDSSWHFLIQDASLPTTPPFILDLDTIKMINGENLLEYDAISDNRFINHHIYLLQLPNARGEVWRLRFEYIKSN